MNIIFASAVCFCAAYTLANGIVELRRAFSAPRADVAIIGALVNLVQIVASLAAIWFCVQIP